MKNNSENDSCNPEEIKEELEKVLSTKLGKEVKIKEITKIGTGYHSDGFKIVTNENQEFFLKRIKSYDVGFEFPERKIASLLVSHSMANRVNHESNVKSLGVFVHNKEFEEIPDVNEESEIYQIQEFGGRGKSYLQILEENLKKETIDEEDKKEIDSIINYIAEIHKIKHPTNDKKRLDAIYNDFLRNVIGHPEYMLQLFHDMPEDNIVLSPKSQGEFILLVIEYMRNLKNNSERLRAIHGDFWGANIFFKDDGNMYVIDHSRMPWGDPGFDIGLFIGSYVVNYHKTKNHYFKELGDYFLQRYIEKTGDKNIILPMIYALGLIAVIYASPLHVPDLDDETRKSVYKHIVQMLKEKRFYWD